MYKYVVKYVVILFVKHAVYIYVTGLGTSASTFDAKNLTVLCVRICNFTSLCKSSSWSKYTDASHVFGM